MTEQQGQRWRWYDSESDDYERLTNGTVSFRVLHPDGSNLADYLNALEAENEQLRATAALADEMTAREDFIKAVGWFDAATALAACLWFDERFDALTNTKPSE